MKNTSEKSNTKWPDSSSKEFGPYRLNSILTERNGCVVFAATHRRSRKHVVLNIFPPLPQADRERFQSNMELAIRIDHRSIAKITDTGEYDGYQFVAYEPIHGIDLQTISEQEGRLSPAVACAIVRHAAIGLHHVHEQDLFHGGVAPWNLMLEKSGVIKIGGLGVAGRKSDASEMDAEERCYLAPGRSHGELDEKSDIYGLGCTLYRMLSGKTPPSAAERENEIAFPLANIAPELPPELVAVVRGMMAIDDDQRIQMLTQVVGAMCNWASEKEIPGLVSRNCESEAPKVVTNTKKQEIEEAVVDDAKKQPTHVGNQSSARKPQVAQGEIFQEDGADGSKWTPVLLVVLALVVSLGVGGFLVFGEQLVGKSESTPSTVVPPVPPVVAPTGGTRIIQPEQLAHLNAAASQQPVVTPASITAASVAPRQVATAAEASRASTATVTQQVAVVVPNANANPAATNPANAATAVAAVPAKPAQIQSKSKQRADEYHQRVRKQLEDEYGLTEGEWILTPNEFALISSVVSYGQTVTQGSADDALDFHRFVRMHVKGAGKKPWSTGLYIPEVEGIEEGDHVLVVVWLRTAPKHPTATGKVSLFVEDASDFRKEVYMTVKPTREWRQFLIPFRAKIAKNLRVGFHLAFQKQDIDYGGLTMVNYGKSAPFWDTRPEDSKKAEDDRAGTANPEIAGQTPAGQTPAGNAKPTSGP